MSNHTPGPWTLCRIARTAVDAGKKHIAMVNYYQSANPDVALCGAEHESNARLIAAAPDLLEALEEMVRDFGGEQEDMDGADVINRARAAITKATTPSA